MLLIVEDPARRATRSETRGQAVYARMVGFGNELKSQDVLLGVESLTSHSQAARVKVRGGKARCWTGRSPKPGK